LALRTASYCTGESHDGLRRAAHQRRLFVAIVLNGVSLDAVAADLGVNRNAGYNVQIWDSRGSRPVPVTA
jgi:transposase